MIILRDTTKWSLSSASFYGFARFEVFEHVRQKASARKELE